jgi:hypothetical protein
MDQTSTSSLLVEVLWMLALNFATMIGVIVSGGILFNFPSRGGKNSITFTTK